MPIRRPCKSNRLQVLVGDMSTVATAKCSSALQKGKTTLLTMTKSLEWQIDKGGENSSYTTTPPWKSENRGFLAVTLRE